MNAPGISVCDLDLDLAGQPLFRKLNLDLPGGCTTCLLGPSGCGKSTLLRLLAGAPDLPYSGTLHLGTGTSRVAWMSQHDLLLPWLTLLDNVLLGARLRGETPDRTLALRLIREAGLEQHAAKLPAALSGGMRQRAALLRTLMEQRPVILMDEPFSALDALTRSTLQNLAARLTAGATVVLVTHDPLEALRLGHRIIVLGGTPARVLEIRDLSGQPPRPPHDPDLLPQYADILGRLMAGAA